MPARSFTDLEVWRLADELDSDIYRLAQSLPPDERFRLADQMIRAARSIPANIAEGFGWYWPRQEARSYGVAKASCGELSNHLLVAAKRGWCKDPQPILGKIDRLERLLHRLIQSALRMPLPPGHSRT